MTAVEIVAGILAEHSTFAWNRASTRIRCGADGCGAVMDASGDADAIIMFARHQAQQLPAAAAVAVPSAPAPEPAEPPAVEPATEPDSPEPDPEGHPLETALSEPVLIEAEEGAEEPPAAVPEATVPKEAAEAPAETAQAGPAADATAPKKARRDTKALGATIAELKKGDRVLAVFNTPRYGSFSLEGTVIKGGAGQDRDQLIVGGWLINASARAAKHLQELTVIATAGNHEFEIAPMPPLPEHFGGGG
ncbi:MAG TPA: hypothetical protein VF867_11205 [Arthrobacter sp.]